MDGRTKKASSSSSLTSELFGSKVNPLPSSSSGTFRSIFAPPSKVMGRESMQMQQDTVTAGWNEKSSKIGDVNRQREEQDNLGSVYQDQRVQPCHLSSSIYYGGPDVYFQSQDSSSNSTENKKEGGEDDSGSASRGNWWKGIIFQSSIILFCSLQFLFPSLNLLENLQDLCIIE
ncbi:unnamed protein product [Brassica rapa]|uniref:Uncharacterized protein n=1 Tax=Brassica campestris TaxID=3711 RepID=A0A3P6A1U6_BRACM|nr:unnamed protein product [Brassica rapa]VDC78218.1 unnamed protein product [Brassica rapa]